MVAIENFLGQFPIVDGWTKFWVTTTGFPFAYFFIIGDTAFCAMGSAFHGSTYSKKGSLFRMVFPVAG
jgi:hypothetical protein